VSAGLGHTPGAVCSHFCCGTQGAIGGWVPVFKKKYINLDKI